MKSNRKLLAGVLLAGALVFAPSAQAEKQQGSKFFLGGGLDGTYTINTGSPNISALLLLDNKLGLQFFAGIPAVSPFAFDLGAQVKYAVFGTQRKGFFLGGGFGLGIPTGGVFAFNIGIGMGFQFEIVENILVALGSGFRFAISSAAGSTVGFSLGGSSPIHNVSIMYGF